MPSMYDWTISRSGPALRITGHYVDAKAAQHENYRLTGVSAVTCRDGRIVAMVGERETCDLASGPAPATGVRD